MSGLDELIYGIRTIFAAGVELVARNALAFSADFIVNDNEETGRTEVALANGPAFSTTRAAFTQPAVSATVAISLSSTTWMSVGQIVYVATGGYYRVSAITNATHATLTNLGYDGNASPTTSVAALSKVSPGGLAGADGVDNGIGAYASRPSAGNAGRRYTPTDGYGDWIDDGSTWRPLVGRGPIVGTSVDTSSFTPFGTSVSLGGAKGAVEASANAGSARLAGGTLAKSSGQSLTVAIYSLSQPQTSGAREGICVTDGSGKYISLQLDFTTGLSITRWSNTTTVSSTVNLNVPWVPPLGAELFLRIRDDGSSLHFEWSPDGLNFESLHTEAYGNFLSGGGNAYGVALLPKATFFAGAVYRSWLIG